MTTATFGYATGFGPKGRSIETLNGMAHRHHAQWATGDGMEDEFALNVTVSRLDDLQVFVGGALMRPDERGTTHDYAVRGLTPGYNGDTNRVRFTVPPSGGADIAFLVIGG